MCTESQMLRLKLGPCCCCALLQPDLARILTGPRGSSYMGTPQVHFDGYMDEDTAVRVVLCDGGTCHCNCSSCTCICPYDPHAALLKAQEQLHQWTSTVALHPAMLGFWKAEHGPGMEVSDTCATFLWQKQLGIRSTCTVKRLAP